MRLSNTTITVIVAGVGAAIASLNTGAEQREEAVVGVRERQQRRLDEEAKAAAVERVSGARGGEGGGRGELGQKKGAHGKENEVRQQRRLDEEAKAAAEGERPGATVQAQQQESDPQQQESDPQQQESDPQQQESDPQQQESDPQQQESDPQQQESDPQQQESDPQQQESDPQQQESAFAQSEPSFPQSTPQARVQAQQREEARQAAVAALEASRGRSLRSAGPGEEGGGEDEDGEEGEERVGGERGEGGEMRGGVMGGRVGVEGGGWRSAASLETEKERKRQERREHYRRLLPPEPGADVASEERAVVAVRLPCGTVCRREWRRADTVGDIYNWLHTLPQEGLLPFPLSRASLATTFPRRLLPLASSASVSLEQADLCPRAVLVVEEEVNENEGQGVGE
ncbi:unnamed protein product [Closterium sp. Naga37s-1]|nr:unnamed protein product [Closterium sp. Naga37s-1]